MTGLIDIGLNLMHKSFDKNREEIIRNANDVGVSQFIITGTNIHSSETALEFARQDQFKGVLFSEYDRTSQRSSEHLTYFILSKSRYSIVLRPILWIFIC